MNSQLQYLLNSEGHYYTQARQLIFDIIDSHATITVKELREKTSDRIPASSLYRALQVFRELLIINDVVIGGVRKVELSGEFRPHHHHLSCQSCKKSIDIHDEQLERYLEQLAKKNGYAHFSHSFEVTGLCQQCAAIDDNLASRNITS